ncbi:tail protein X [Candidatus Albibeggiatoa sp. nov. NOAA]|uniref:tail protein X n=1 Tax=Candidatus Albibeggiatoa sp. nov. NOAA TaxID=3162724 RepID=UPI0032F84AD4|nr:tail protein X [Thiotrichaceae bacterium]
MAQWYTCQQGDMLDDICHRHYELSHNKALSFVLQHPENQNLADQGVFYETGQQVFLPDLPNELTVQENQRQIKIFDV